MEIKLKKYQFMFIDEKRTSIKYEGVEEKGPRPFLVVRPSMYGNLFIACPITDAETHSKQTKSVRKSYLKIEFDGKESYIKMNMPIIFDYSIIKEGIAKPIDRFLNKSIRNVALRLLKESFDD